MKKQKVNRLLVLLAIIAMLAALSSCGKIFSKDCEHEYDDTCDDSCNLCDEMREISHTYDNACDTACNVCGVVRNTSHVYTNACDVDCNACSAVRDPIHEYSNPCDMTCNICGAVRITEHIYTNDCDMDCNSCGAVRVTEHIYTSVCDTTCNICGAARTASHIYTNASDADCNICGYVRNISGGTSTTDDWYADISYQTTELRFQMTHNSYDQELPSGCARYLAGDNDAGTWNDDIDELVEKRNNDAYSITNVSVIYTYYPDTQGYGVYRMYDTIYSEVASATASSPDIYCNFMTDMLVTSLKGSFANLKSIQYANDNPAGKSNYFKFEDPGYMADLMGSLTLSPERMYVIASDYFIDLIRAFFVVPVNAELYNRIAPVMIDDLNGDGEKDINDIFVEVKNGDWTYERLAEYSDAIYTDCDGVEGESIGDVLGFGLGQNGLPAAGLVYSSYVTIINKVSLGNSKYDYSYSAENQDLYDLSDAISTLINATGVKMVTSDDKNTLAVSEVDTPLLAIRHQFTNNKMLFGGIILVGYLEYSQYQTMKDNGYGFGVLPVPVYEKIDHDGDGDYSDEYNTQIHSVGRAGGISAATKKFVQATAFLNYQSSNSTEILNEYYDYNLMYDIASSGGVEGNVEMLKFIRGNIKTGFEKYYEDAIGMLASSGDLDASARWHNIILKQGYDCNMRNAYAKYWYKKNISLQDIVTHYNTLPS